MTLGEVLTPTPDRQRAALVALGGVLAALFLAAVALTSEPFLPMSVGPGQDARAYWTAPLESPYLNSTVGEESAYL